MENARTFNLENCEFPNVLLAGNGPFRNEGFTWAELLRKTAKCRASVDKYVDNDGFTVPNTILTIATAQQDDAKRAKIYSDAINSIQYSKNTISDALIKLPFNAILTTNYSYEWEHACDEHYPDYSDYKKNKCARKTIPDRDKKYRIHSYNSVNNGPEIWHVHGEGRTPSSIVLTHEEYAKLIRNIVDYSASRGHDMAKSTENFVIKSWVDYLTVGNVYVLGYAMDFAEFDMWWLLNKRLRCDRDRIGKIVFYEPYKEASVPKINALKDIGIECLDLGVEIDEKCRKSDKYAEFYALATKDIEERLSRK